ncbi:Molybdopterin-guanine dinucleotide biosynthesis protein B [Budvicia aquatica]|nr:Molybdopterin-guanine dinucleotide biosynthesis protein B [Budvicia aquatica]
MTETPDNAVNLSGLITQFNPDLIDLVLIEGFKHEPVNKIALFRSSIAKPFEGLIDQYVIALATDDDIELNIPKLDINNPAVIAKFIQTWLNSQKIEKY